MKKKKTEKKERKTNHFYHLGLKPKPKRSIIIMLTDCSCLLPSYTQYLARKSSACCFRDLINRLIGLIQQSLQKYILKLLIDLIYNLYFNSKSNMKKRKKDSLPSLLKRRKPDRITKEGFTRIENVTPRSRMAINFSHKIENSKIWRHLTALRRLENHLYLERLERKQ